MSADADHVECGEVQRWALAHHRNRDDFDSGDLLDRLSRFDYFEVMELPITHIDLDEFEVLDELVDDYVQMPAPGPPIVYDQVNGSMIDGIHRANAAARRGAQTIAALVGTRNTLEGCPTPRRVVSIATLLPTPDADQGLQMVGP